eukprot:NODE_81_length_22758_cov_0.877797.p16 type:complete len:151 gc:universal NODE_81_length_22758_cov_0.877797:8918-8466(-)
MEDFLTQLPKRTIDEAVHIAAASLKSFIREIPEGLWVKEWFILLSDYAENHKVVNLTEKDDALFKLVKRQTVEMPYPSYVVTKILFHLLRQINFNKEENLMSTSNLLIIWAPNLCKFVDTNQMVSQSKSDGWVGILVTYYIEYYDDIFRR